MRRIATSGGLELGHPDGPWIDIIPMGVSYRNVSLELGKQAARWGQWHPVGSGELPPSAILNKDEWEGVIAIWAKEGLSLRFLHRPEQAPTVALKAIEAVEPDIPPAIIGAILTVCRLKDRLSNSSLSEHVSMAARHTADVCGMRSRGRSSLSRKAINRLVDRFLDTLADGGKPADASLPDGAVDSARFWIELARRIWWPDVRQRLTKGADEVALLGWLSMVAPIGACLNKSHHVEVAGTSLYLHPSAYEQAWMQTMAWEAGGISGKALQFLTAGQFPTGNFALARTRREPATSRSYDADVARGITASLLREAEEEAAYVPSGEFIVRFPENYPLRRWRIAGLRVYARPDHLWVMALAEDGKSDTSFRWAPTDNKNLARDTAPPSSRWVIDEDAVPLVDVTLAALWRDLRCAGSDALPLPSSKPRRQARSRASHQVRRPQRSKSRTVRHLPRPRRIALGGERDWGDQIDRETIERRAHGVRGHLRRLPADWRVSAEARELARSFSLTLPDGYTFVRPHVRAGRGDEDIEAPGDDVIVVAQGLATVMFLL